MRAGGVARTGTRTGKQQQRCEQEGFKTALNPGRDCRDFSRCGPRSVRLSVEDAAGRDVGIPQRHAARDASGWPRIRRPPEWTDASMRNWYGLFATRIAPDRYGSDADGAEEVRVLRAEQVVGDRFAALLQAHDPVLDHPELAGKFFRCRTTSG